MEIIKRSGLLEKIGRENTFPTLALALDTIWEVGHEQSDENTCPLKNIVRLENNA